jgi:hypothetical protein
MAGRRLPEVVLGIDSAGCSPPTWGSPCSPPVLRHTRARLCVGPAGSRVARAPSRGDAHQALLIGGMGNAVIR